MGLRVLIVEDEQIIAADLADKLTGLGHEVLGMAIAGEEAVQLAGQLKPDLVLMDIQLEGDMPGTEAARRIRERTGAQIIFVTAFPNAFLRDPERGVCVGKPFSRSQIEASIRAATSRREGETGISTGES